MLATGVTFGSHERETMFEYASLAQTHGVESLWIGESWGEASVPLITQLLDRTDQIDICAGIFNIYARTPGMTAMTANTLADIGDGRFRLGLGTSGPAVIENFHGVAFDNPLRRTREYIEIIRRLLAGERLEYDGELFELTGFSLDVDTLHQVPLYVAAMGEKNRQLTGEFGDGWMPLLVPNTGMDDALAAVERGCEQGDRSIEEIDVSPWIPTCISESEPQVARDHVRSLIAFYIGAMGEYYANTATAFGYGEEATAIRTGWKDDRQSGAEAAVTEEMISAFGAAGSPTQAAESFDRFKAAGVDSPVAYVPSRWAGDEIVRETILNLSG